MTITLDPRLDFRHFNGCIGGNDTDRPQISIISDSNYGRLAKDNEV